MMARVFLRLLIIWGIWGVGYAPFLHADPGPGAARIDLPAAAVTPEDVVAVGTYWSQDGLAAGGTVQLAVVLDVKPGFHINADSAQIRPLGGVKLVPTTVEPIAVDSGLAVGAPRFPPATPVPVGFADTPLMAFGERTRVVVPISAAPGASAGRQNLAVRVGYQACDDQTCLFPRTVTVEAAIAIRAPGEPIRQIHEAIFSGSPPESPEADAAPVNFDLFGWTFSLKTTTTFGLGLLMATAALGGLLLNFTPCVLPLMPVKIIGLSHAAAQDRRRSLMLGTAMFSGVLGFWILLGLLIALVSGFTAANQLFQYPLFTISIGVIIAFMALGMCGLFHARLPQFLYLFNPDQNSLPGSFALGILTAILSTPCTAPFMGAAAAWAATRSPVVTLSTFAAIGTGMALPYLICSAWPSLVRRIPRSGPGSALLKQVMGMLMLAAGVYFIGSGLSAVLAAAPDPPARGYWWAVAICGVAAGCWLVFRCFRITRRQAYRWVFGGLGVLLVWGSVSAGYRLTDPGPIDWIYYTPDRFQAALSRNQTVVMVFTAEWCLNCKALEQSVLRDPRVVALLAERDVAPVKVDITGHNPAGKARLRETGSLTIPLLAVFSDSGTLRFKSDFYTADQVVAAVASARGK